MEIRPVSDLRNKFLDIEKIVNKGEPVFLTKNRYGAMVELSLEEYPKLTNLILLSYERAGNVYLKFLECKFESSEVRYNGFKDDSITQTNPA